MTWAKPNTAFGWLVLALMAYSGSAAAQSSLNLKVVHHLADSSVVYIFLPAKFQQYEQNATDVFGGEVMLSTRQSGTIAFKFLANPNYTAADDRYLILGILLPLPITAQYKLTLKLECLDADYTATDSIMGTKYAYESPTTLDLVDQTYLTPVPNCCLQLNHGYLIRVDKPGGYVEVGNAVGAGASQMFEPQQDTVMRFVKPATIRLHPNWQGAAPQVFYAKP